MTSDSRENQKIIFVIGSTASGKSQWAMSLAKKYNGSILNIDSVQFYEGLVIGSAAPTQAEKSEIPHYLYNYVQAPIEMTAGQFLRDFYQNPFALPSLYIPACPWSFFLYFSFAFI